VILEYIKLSFCIKNANPLALAIITDGKLVICLVCDQFDQYLLKLSILTVEKSDLPLKKLASKKNEFEHRGGRTTPHESPPSPREHDH
jgi:hypothetical protein